MVQVVFGSVSVTGAVQWHAGLWKRAGWNRGEPMWDSCSWIDVGRSLQNTQQNTHPEPESPTTLFSFYKSN